MQKIYIDSFQLHSNTQDIGFVVKTPIQGLDSPTIRISSYDKVGEWGAYMSNQLYSSRLITLEGYVYAYDIPTFNTRRRLLESSIRIKKDSNSVPVAHLLQFTTMDGLTVQANGYISKVQFNMENILVASFRLEFVCPDYPLYSATTFTDTISAPSGGGVVIPVIFPMILAAKAGGEAPVFNNGTIEVLPQIILNGPLTSPVIQNNTLTRYISLNMTIPSGEVVTIDMLNKQVVIGTQSQLINVVSGSNWWWLAPGENDISLTTSSLSDTGNAQIIRGDGYIGV